MMTIIRRLADCGSFLYVVNWAFFFPCISTWDKQSALTQLPNVTDLYQLERY